MRSKAGSIPFSFKMFAMVPRETWCPTWARAPLILVYPQREFSRAMRRTRLAMSSLMRGRPGFLLAL